MRRPGDEEATAGTDGTLWLDLAGERLWRGTTAVRLRLKSFAVLRHLVARPGQIASKQDLFEAVWPGTVVTDGVLTVCINELRATLGDTAQTPRYIETVHRRGYRWIGTLPLAPPSPPEPRPGSALRPQLAIVDPTPVVGRDAAALQLEAGLARARAGERQVVFVTGEAGLGKTTLVDAFAAALAGDPSVWLARGHCIEHYGTGEPYLPVLDALGQLCRGPSGPRLVDVLAQHAPTWLMQMPALVSEAVLEAVQRRVVGATRERMLRELTEAIESVSAERTVVLVLEDLHWCDVATLDLVGALARRRVSARLLLLGTYRPVEVIVRGHPLHALKLDLSLHRQCVELPLELLTRDDVAEYLGQRFGPRVATAPVAAMLHRRTDGHPLFLVTVADALVERGLVREVNGRTEVSEDLAAIEAVVPDGLRHMITRQFDTLSADAQRMLEAASVAGLEHTVAAVAAGVEAAVDVVEAQCADLVERGLFLRAHGTETWPDGTVTGRYRFRHTLYQQAIYERLPVGRRMRLHHLVGMRLEAGYGPRAEERAAELARHFAEARASALAAAYWQQAAVLALKRCAYTEAVAHLRRGLDALPTLDDTPDRRRRELALLLALGQALIATKGAAASEVGALYHRAWELCEELGERPQQLAVLRGLRRFHLGRAEFEIAKSLAARCLTTAQQLDSAPLLAEAHAALGTAAFYLGELPTARTHFERGLAACDPDRPDTELVHYGQVPAGLCLTYGAVTEWLMGYPDRALDLAEQGLAVARSLGQTFGYGMSLAVATSVFLLRGDTDTGHERARELLALARAHEMEALVSLGELLWGWALAVAGHRGEGLAHMRHALATRQGTGHETGRVMYLTVLAEQHGHAGEIQAGLDVLSGALGAAGPRLWEPEIHRVRGALLFEAGRSAPMARRRSTDAEAQACFESALALSRRQGAKAFELRSATGLAWLWLRQGKSAAAHRRLADVYSGFTEGFDTADLTQARAALEAASS